MIFVTLHCTFPHSCFYPSLVAGLSWYIFSYLSIAYSGSEMHSTLTHEQPAYLCTARLPMHTLHIQYKDIMDALFL